MESTQHKPATFPADPAGNKAAPATSGQAWDQSADSLMVGAAACGGRRAGGQQQWRVEGMHCGGCASRLESVLRGLPGVSDAMVNFATGLATVSEGNRVAGGGSEGTRAERGPQHSGNPPLTFEERVEKAVREAGFVAKPVGVEDGASYWAGEKDAAGPGRFLWAAVGFLPLLAGTMGAHFWPESPMALQFKGQPLFEALLSGGVVFGAGSGILAAAFRAVLRRVPDMDFLVGVGAVLAWSGSLYAWWSGQTGTAGHGGGYFEVAAGIVTFSLFGRWLELRNRIRAGEAIRSLAQLQPGLVRVAVEGQVREVPLAEVRPGDVVLVAPGERVAVDGVILEGSSALDEAWVSGESAPVLRGKGDLVTGGTVNGDGALQVRVSAAGREAFLQQVLRIVQEAQSSKPPVQRLADKVAGRFALGVLLLALGTGLCWALVSPEGSRLHNAFWHGLTVMVVACPCAVGLATPVAVLAGTGRAAQEGVLFRSGAALEVLSKVRTVVFDKTGTLTRGRLEVAEWWESRSFHGRLLEMVAAAQQHSAHPAGAAVVRAARGGGAKLPLASSVRAIPGRGLMAEVAGMELLVGTYSLLKEAGVELPHDPQDGRTWIAAEGLFCGWFRLEDQLRPEAAGVVAQLRKRGISSVLLSGDHPGVAEKITTAAGIQKFVAGVRPDEKRQMILELQSTGPTAMLGDGVNDAPALAQADVGIAMAGGTAVARQTSDITLIRDDLRLLLTAMDLSRKTLRVIRQNLALAFGYNALAIPLAAGILGAWGGWVPGPLAASAAMALSSVSVVLNALRLRRGNLR